LGYSTSTHHFYAGEGDRRHQQKKIDMKSARQFLPILFLFIILNAIFIGFRSFLEANGFDQEVLIYSNLLLFGVTVIGFLLQRRGLTTPNPHAFVRSVYLSMIIKLLVCMIVVVIYITNVGNDVNKPSLFVSMGLYLVYTAMEVVGLMKSAKRKNG
jgi:hypothetical protein